MASDSRIQFGGSFSDVGVKVMRLPVHVYGTEGRNGRLNTLLRKQYGFCYSGSLANASTFKALIEDVLDGLQFLGEEQTLSFDKICEFVTYYCSKVSTAMCSCLFEKGQYGFFLTGYCPIKSRPRAALFSFRQVDGQSIAEYEEVASEDGSYMAIGSGADEARRLITEVNNRAMLLLLNRVIDEKRVESVGGDIQYGRFSLHGDFCVYAITRISNEHACDGERKYGPSKLRLFRYRGFHLYENWKPTSNFWPSPPCIDLEVPSNEESQAYFIEKCRKTIAAQ